MIARAEAGTDCDGMVDFDAASVARDVAELYEPLAEDRGMHLSLDVEPGLALHGSRELIGQAVANLVDNALKYGTARVEGRRDGNYGGGRRALGSCGEAARPISSRSASPIAAPALRSKIARACMDRFVRLENSRSRPGSGLGLCACRRRRAPAQWRLADRRQ